ncbi:MAG: tRNA (adenosine(37)-N6)-threonylcarbamoyltransferase complex dimerization subunit type 1 TsaB [Gemmatimonadota bacterium]|nr:MAG: tRNA (adenosine(37)-N6)-threonylcarbamoyltransferase complex dimerization subunit type 1 TsaB [Gemmatimonadota bacterium]
MSCYLAVDSATEVGSVAVGEPGHVVAEILVSDRRHATALAPAVQQVMKLAGVAHADLTGIVIGDGPGSFTGLRIGFATVKGILFQRPELTLHTIPSLLACAWPFKQLAGGPIAALYDALRGEVFAAIYRFSNQTVATELAPCLTTVTQLTELEGVVPSLALGNGAVLYRDLVRSWTGREPVGPPLAAPRAGALLELLALAAAVTLVRDPDTLEPNYGRLAEAQVKWEATHGRELKRGGTGREGRKGN